MKMQLAWLTYNHLATENEKMGIHKNPYIVKLEHEFAWKFMAQLRVLKVLDIN